MLAAVLALALLLQTDDDRTRVEELHRAGDKLVGHIHFHELDQVDKVILVSRHLETPTTLRASDLASFLQSANGRQVASATPDRRGDFTLDLKGQKLDGEYHVALVMGGMAEIGNDVTASVLSNQTPASPEPPQRPPMPADSLPAAANSRPYDIRMLLYSLRYFIPLAIGAIIGLWKYIQFRRRLNSMWQ